MKTGKGVKPKAAIRFLKRKKIVETERWDDLKWGEHSHAFTVAHSLNAGILDDLHEILVNAMDNGESFGKTKREIKGLMAKKGWYGRTPRRGRQDIDPDNPDPRKRKKAKKYINWRIGIIYRQNMLTAYSAGQTRKLWSIQHLYPFWQYKQLQRPTKRDAHSPWHNMVLRANDPAWGAITPPNDWNCGCYRVPLDEEQAEEAWADGALKALPADGKINPTWAYDPAREAFAPNWKSYRNLRKAGVIKDIQHRYRDDIAKTQMNQGEWQTFSRAVLEKEKDDGEVPLLVATLAQVVADDTGFDPKLMGTTRTLRHGARGRGEKKGEFNPDRDLSLEEIALMPQNLASPDAIYVHEGKYLFVYVLDATYEACVVFRQNGDRPLQLVTYSKVKIGVTESVSDKKLYTRK